MDLSHLKTFTIFFLILWIFTFTKTGARAEENEPPSGGDPPPGGEPIPPAKDKEKPHFILGSDRAIPKNRTEMCDNGKACNWCIDPRTYAQGNKAEYNKKSKKIYKDLKELLDGYCKSKKCMLLEYNGYMIPTCNEGDRKLAQGGIISIFTLVALGKAHSGLFQ